MLSSLLLLKMVISGFFLVWLRLEITVQRSVLQQASGYRWWSCCRRSGHHHDDDDDDDESDETHRTRAETAAVHTTVHVADYLAQLMTWIELSVFLGYAIPLLLPLLALAVYASKCALETLAVQPGVVIEGADAPLQVGPLAYVVFGGLLMNGMMAFVFAESRLRGGMMVLLMACACSCAMVAVYVAKRCGYSYEQACSTRMTTRRASYVQMLPREASARVDVGEDEVGDDGFAYHAM